MGAIWERSVVVSNAYRFSKILKDVIGASGGHNVFFQKSRDVARYSLPRSLPYTTSAQRAAELEITMQLSDLHHRGLLVYVIIYF